MPPERLAQIEGRAERWLGALHTDDPQALMARDALDLKREVARVSAELVEARAEIAARNGERTGAIGPLWVFCSNGAWTRLVPGGRLIANVDTWSGGVWDGTEDVAVADHVPTRRLRDSMRVAEAEARRRGWLL